MSGTNVLLSQCILTVIVSLMLVRTLPQSLSMMMMHCLSMTMSMAVGNMYAPLHETGMFAKMVKFATDVDDLATGLRTAMLISD